VSGSRTRAGAELSGVPRADLLPQEVKDGYRSARQRRWLVFGVFVAVCITGAAWGLSIVVANDAQQALAREQDRTIQLLAQQAEFGEVRDATAAIELIASGQYIGALTEIQWRPFVAAVQATLPEGVTIVEFTITSASPIATLSQPESPLLGVRSATIEFTAESIDLPNVREWLDNLEQVPGFTDATPGAVRLNDGTGLYEATITLGISDVARSGRFTPSDDTSEQSVDEEAEG
jgi:Tfp pilus assembly protein PilN